MQRISRAPVLSATRSRDSCWITDRHLPRRSCPIAAQGGGWQGRRERPCLDGMGVTEDAARRRPARPSGCELCGRGRSLCSLHDLRETPVLRLRERARLDDPDDIPDLGLVALVVDVEALGAPHDLLVAAVRLDRVDLDDDRLVGLVGDDGALALLAAAGLVL